MNFKKIIIIVLIIISILFTIFLIQNKREVIIMSSIPLLQLNDKVVSIYKDDGYNESGYKATDKIDGDITNKVIVKGKVDTSKVGNYVLEYSVSNSSNKSISKKKKVIVKKRTNYKTIYLTFDDGPSSVVTPQILDVLKKENVKATFFVINTKESLNYLIKRAYDEGHTIALHSYTHEYDLIYKSESSYFNDLNKISNKVKKITGEKSKIIRFPGGTSNTVSSFNPNIMTRLSKKVIKKGYHYFDWNIDSNDTNYYVGSNGVYKNVIKNLLYKQNVVLMHDTNDKEKNVRALKMIIKYGKNKEYAFEKITLDTPLVTHYPNN